MSPSWSARSSGMPWQMTSFTLAQSSVPMAEWSTKNGIKKVVTMVSDYGPGIDAEKAFSDRLVKNGGKIVEAIRVPLRNPEFAPFIQRIKDAKPDAVFVFVPAGTQATAIMKIYGDLGMAKAGIKLIGPGDLTPDEELPNMVSIPSTDDPATTPTANRAV